MGTSVSITVYDKDDREYLSGAFDLIYEIERKISNKIDSSYISQINKMAGKEEVVVPDDVFELIKYSLYISDNTEGLFNPLIGALSSLWAIGTENAKVPEKSELDAALALVDRDDIVLDDQKNSVYLKKEGMMLDLGGIGKGYAADAIKEYLLSKNVERAIINLGGNIYTIGRKSEDEAFKVGIMDPEESGKYILLIDAENISVVTSGAYERFFEQDGALYHHILDSNTGYPYETDLLSASIITDESTLADGLSTAVFAGGTSYAKEIANKFSVSIVLYTKNHEIIKYGEL